jgi:2-methylcitrate dehydratase PrpD
VSADAVPAEVTVHARGQNYTRKVLVPSGDPRNPMTQAERREKFMACTHDLVPIPAASGLFNALEDLEHCTDLRNLLAPLRGATAGT